MMVTSYLDGSSAKGLQAPLRRKLVRIVAYSLLLTDSRFESFVNILEGQCQEWDDILACTHADVLYVI